MNSFDTSSRDEQLQRIYLKRLGLPQRDPSLSYLNELINAHQHLIPFETHTRILDFHQHHGNLPSLETYINRLSSGCGGVCWTLARGFKWLLENLGFSVNYLYMKPGHVCLSVKVDEQEWYADVGYAAPFFEAKPLNQSFRVLSSSEDFDYQVNIDEVIVTRTPGPTKVLSLKPVSEDILSREFQAINVWGQNKFLTTLTYNRYFQGRLLRFTNDTVFDYREGRIQERKLSYDEIEDFLRKDLGVDSDYYFKSSLLLTPPK